MKLFCKHNFKKEENILYCTKCDKTIILECAHNWEHLEKITIRNAYDGDKIDGFERILKCTKCGDLKKFIY